MIPAPVKASLPTSSTNSAMVGALQRAMGQSSSYRAARLSGLERYQSDPDSFIRHVLGIPVHPDPWPGSGRAYVWPHQQNIIHAVAGVGDWKGSRNRTSVASCHAIGKDWTAATIAVWFTACFQPSITITTGPTDRQVKLLLWGEIKNRIRGAKR